MGPTFGFFFFLGLTVVLLGVVVWSGLRARRSVHLCSVVSAVACLGISIVYAWRLGELYDLESAGWITPVHLMIAKVTTALYLAPIATGIATLLGKDVKRLHRAAAFLVVALTLITTATGAWMLAAAERL